MQHCVSTILKQKIEKAKPKKYVNLDQRYEQISHLKVNFFKFTTCPK